MYNVYNSLYMEVFKGSHATPSSATTIIKSASVKSPASSNNQHHIASVAKTSLAIHQQHFLRQN